MASFMGDVPQGMDDPNAFGMTQQVTKNAPRPTGKGMRLDKANKEW